ncbi:MAG TPA: hypothetical protein VF157_06345, partial [Chloroflexota bacterium]
GSIMPGNSTSLSGNSGSISAMAGFIMHPFVVDYRAQASKRAALESLLGRLLLTIVVRHSYKKGT